MVNACTSLGSYASYVLDCPVYRQGASAMSQLNTTDPSCLPCVGACPGVAPPAAALKATGGAGAHALGAGAAAAVAAAAAALVAAALL